MFGRVPLPTWAKPHDRPLRLHLHVFILLSWISLRTYRYVISAIADAKDSAGKDGALFGLRLMLARSCALVPFSVFEVILAALIVLTLALVARAVFSIVVKKRHLLNALVCGFLLFLSTALVTDGLMLLGKGVRHKHRSLAAQLGWQEANPSGNMSAGQSSSLPELAHWSAELVQITNTAYVEATGNTDLGKPSAPISLSEGDVAIEGAYSVVTHRFRLNPSYGEAYGRAKPLCMSPLLPLFGNPTGFVHSLTCEANYNYLAPPAKLMHTIAHEKAHQRGIHTESEANFIGFLSCIYSTHAYARYSGYWFAQALFIHRLSLLDKERADALRELRHPGVQRDYDAMHEFVCAKHSVAGPPSERYVSAYSDISLFTAFAQANGGSFEVADGTRYLKKPRPDYRVP